MYQATIGQRAQTSQGKRAGKAVSMTPNVKASAKMAMSQDRWNQLTQSASKLNTAAKREQIRRFGEYHGEDGNQPQQTTQSIWQNTPFEALPTGYKGSRDTRCVDRFVRYPYPKTLFSNYRQNYHGKLAQTDVKNHKNAFNLEKETKIINPHAMDLKTTHKQKYRGDKGEPVPEKAQEIVGPKKPIQ